MRAVASKLAPLLVLGGGLVVPAVAAQATIEAAVRAESLSAAGRPWHAAEALLAITLRESSPTAELVVAGARAELHARRYERARTLLLDRPWLDAYQGGEALALLAEAEAKLGLHLEAARRFAAAANRASEPLEIGRASWRERVWIRV